MKPSIYEHTNYRTYLQAFVSFKKAKQPQWTYGQWAKALGLKATTSITMVLNGQRQPGEGLARSLALYFKFDENEQHYFYNLIQLSKAGTESHLKEILKKEITLHAARESKDVLDPNVFTMISNWYYLAIRQMAKTPYFNPSAKWIVNSLRFSITEKTAEHAVRTLKKLKLLAVDKNGNITLSKAPVSTENDVAREAYKIYHEEVTKLALKAIRTIPVHERQFRALTLPISKNQLPQAKELIQKFADDFDKLLYCSEGGEIYHLNLQLFPVASLNNDQKGAKEL